MITPTDQDPDDIALIDPPADETGTEVLGVCDPEIVAEALPEPPEQPVEGPKKNNSQLVVINRGHTAQSMDTEGKIYDLAREGKSIPAIALQLHITRTNCRTLLERAFSIRIKDLEKSAAKFRHRETMALLKRRLDIEVAIEKAMKKSDFEAIARLADADTKISAQLAKLNGLNAAEKTQATVVHLTYDQCREYLDAGQSQILEE